MNGVTQIKGVVTLSKILPLVEILTPPNVLSYVQ